MTQKLTFMKQLRPLSLLLVFVLLIKNGFSKTSHSYPDSHQLYLTTNKEIYLPAETICFQAFLINTPADISTSIFVELYDCTGNKVLSKKLPMENNIGAGSFVLPALKSDYYLLYCYTPGEDGKPGLDFIKKIAVDENVISSGNTENKNFYAPDLAVDYYFEGGSFVNELSNNILIKTSTKDNKSISVFGKIVNQKNEVVSIFNTSEQGFVNVTIFPYKNEKCSLVIKDNLGNAKTIALPDALSEGLTFKLVTLEKSILYVAQLNSGMYNTPLNFTLDILKDNEPVFQSALKFDEGKSQQHEEIDNNNLPGGYLTVRIRDDNKKVYVERVFYNGGNAEKTNTINIVDSVNNKTYSVPLPDYISGTGCISINAIEKNKTRFIQSNAATIGKNLHTPELSSDINFSKFNDYLISVKNIAAGNNILPVAENKLISLSGTLYAEGNKPVKNKKINIVISLGKNKKQLYEAITDQNGRLIINNLLFFDTATVYYQLADKSEGKNDVRLVLDKQPNVYLSRENEKLKDYLCANQIIINNSAVNNVKNPEDNSKDSKTLNEVTVKNNAAVPKTDKKNFTEKYVSANFDFAPMMREEFDFITTPREDIDFETVAEFIRGRIPEVRVVINNHDYSAQIYNPAVRGLLGIDPAGVQVYINEAEVDDGTGSADIMDLRINEVALIRFYGPGWRPRTGGPSGGTLMIYTKRADDHPDKAVKGLPKLKLAGYDADASQIDATTQPANYSTLFWKPNYTFDGNKIIYTNFLPGTKDKTIEVKIEGINNDKIPFTFIKNIVVE